MDAITIVQALILGFATGCIFALLAGGMTMLYAVSKTMFTAHGDVLALAMYLSLSLYGGLKLDPYVSIIITAPVLFVLGMITFRVFMKPVLKESALVFFQIGLGLVFISEEILRMIYTADQRTVPSVVAMDKVYLGEVIIRTPQLIAFIGSIVVSLGFYWMLQKTDFGRHIRAVADKPEAAKLMGINVERVQGVVFGIGFVLCAVAATLVLPFWTLEPYIGLSFALYAIIVLTLGTMGNFLGALLAGMIIGVSSALSQLFWGSNMALTIPYVIFILTLVFMPRGLFGARGSLVR